MATFLQTRLVRYAIVLGLSTGLLLCARPRAAVAQDGISLSAWQQIQALGNEKRSRTPAQQKMDSNMVLALKKNRGVLPAELQSLDLGMAKPADDGRIEVDIRADVTDALLATIKSGGGEIINSHPKYNAIRTRITLEQAEALAALPAVKFIRPGEQFMTNKLTTSAGDHAHRADTARTNFSITGAGIKIGVLSDGVDSSNTLIASGDLPASLTVLPGQKGSGDEGSAMLEIVYDLCPGASLYFATANPSQAQFAANITALRAAGCDIIIDDVFYFLEGVFQDGIVAQAVNSVTHDGALYFSSIGNSGNLDAGTAGCWEGDYVGIPAPPVLAGYASALDFGGGTNYDTITVDSPFYFILSWSDALGASANDYDLFVLNAARTVLVASSTSFQTGTQDPFEYISSTSRDDAGNTIVIAKWSGLDRMMYLTANRGQFGVNTTGQACGHPCAVEAYGVAAAGVPPLAGGTFVGVATTPTLETFSSDGLRRIHYQADGTAITPGNFSSTGGVVRNKPDITAGDGVACSAPGFDPFYGTSAAAPHAGAIAALIMAHNPGITTPSLRARITSYVRDLGAHGYDRDSGFGVMDALCGVTPIELASLDATQYGGAVMVDWRTGYEVSTLGFNIYREENGVKTRVNSQLVAGSALLAGPTTNLTAGLSYSWCDVLPSGTSGVTYWLEDVDLNGNRTLHGPVTPVLSDKPMPKKNQAAFLAQLLKQSDDTQERIQSLRAKLQSAPMAGLNRAAAPLKLAAAPAPSPAKATSGQRETQWALAAKPAVKLSVGTEGWYRVGQRELVAAGLDPKTDPALLQLYVNGVEQPMVVKGNRRFTPADHVEFYGTGQDTLWTGNRTYWLIAGSRPGKRIPAAPGGGGDAISPQSFPFTVERKDRTVYFAALRNGEASNFFGPIISTEPVDQLLTVSHLAPSAPKDATLEVALQGVTAGTHRVAVQLNGTVVGTIVFNGQSGGKASVAIPQRALLEGDNLVTLVAAGGPTDVSLVDAVRLTYWHSYTADNNALRCTAQGGQQLAIQGFTHPGVRVVDITNPGSPVEIKGAVKPQAKNYSVKLQVPGRGQHTLLAFAANRPGSPAGIAANRPSTWHAAGRVGNVAIIAHNSLLGSLRPLKALRESQGRSVALMDVEDLYDEFSFGDKNPQALRDFLALAKAQWKTPPRFVLLAGDASIDPRNYFGLGDCDLVPTKMVDASVMESPSDDWFADLNGDDVPDMAVGRLPVRTAAEAAVVVSKIVGYESTPAGNWTGRALLVADNSDVFSFERASETVKDALPRTLGVDEVFLGRNNIPTVRSRLMEKLNAGELLVNFIGHGTLDMWAGEGLLTNQDVEALTNGPRLPVVLSLTCLNGFMADPARDCLAEALLKAERGGAVAVWTSSGLTEPSDQTLLAKELVRLLFNGSPLTLGEASMGAKAGVGAADVRRTWILFGDPAMRLK